MASRSFSSASRLSDRIVVPQRPVSCWNQQSVRVRSAIGVDRQRNPEHGDHWRLVLRTIADALLYLQVEYPQTGGYMIQIKELQAVEWSTGVAEGTTAST